MTLHVLTILLVKKNTEIRNAKNQLLSKSTLTQNILYIFAFRQGQKLNWFITKITSYKMTAYKCIHCERTFATPYTLKHHISNKHTYTSIGTDEGESSQLKTIYREEFGLWNNDYLLTKETGLWDDDDDLLVEETDLEDDMVRL